MLAIAHTYNPQGLAHHKHQVGVGDVIRVLDKISGNDDQEHGMRLNEKLGRNESHLRGW